MENEEVKENVETNKPKKANRKFLLLGIIITFLLVISIVIRIILILPIAVGNDFYCEYSPKFNKYTCIQTGDDVPEWLNLNTNVLSRILGDSGYSMDLLITKENGDYRTLKMTDSVFITNMKRKFIYEKKEQSVWDYFRFKQYLTNSKISNWGSIVLYCSETNLKDDVCKNMKKYNK